MPCWGEGRFYHDVFHVAAHAYGTLKRSDSDVYHRGHRDHRERGIRNLRSGNAMGSSSFYRGKMLRPKTLRPLCSLCALW